MEGWRSVSTLRVWAEELCNTSPSGHGHNDGGRHSMKRLPKFQIKFDLAWQRLGCFI